MARTVWRATRLVLGGVSGSLGLSSLQTAECERQPDALPPGSACSHRIVVVGGGSAGITVAAQLIRKLGSECANLAVIEPADFHYYRPSFTLTGAGITPLERCRRPMSSVMPAGARWIRARAVVFEPERSTLVLDNGARVEYDWLIVATGMRMEYSGVPGLEEALSRPDSGVCSIWDYRFVENVWRCMQKLGQSSPSEQRCVALFTQPRDSRGCGGAPQKIMWLAEDFWRREALVRPQIEVAFVTGRDALFPIAKYAYALAEIGVERGVEVTYCSELVAVDGARRIATFANADGTRTERRYNLLHITPKMVPPAVVAASPLAAPASGGFVDVDKFTLQHKRYANIFALGDSASVPTSRTIAAITAQAPVVVHNVIMSIRSEADALDRPMARYDGYSSSPILTKRGGLILAEFKYDGGIKETFPLWFDQTKEVSLFYSLFTGFFPYAYWNLMLTGRWYGPRGLFEPRLNFIDLWAMP